MKVIIAGSRGIMDPSVVPQAALQSGFTVTEVVSGTARGVDQLGEAWAILVGIPVRRFPADWNRFGRSAGFRRNAEMAEYADALIAIWDGASRGTTHMIDLARSKGLKVFVFQP